MSVKSHHRSDPGALVLEVNGGCLPVTVNRRSGCAHPHQYGTALVQRTPQPYARRVICATAVQYEDAGRCCLADYRVHSVRMSVRGM